MKQAPFINNNGKIIYIAPSFGATTEPYITRYEKSVKNLKRLGYQVSEGFNVRLQEGVVSSNTPEKRAEEFMLAYQSDNDVLLSTGGGELMCEMLPFVDFEKLKQLPPKWFVGYSDNTNLTFTLTTLCDVITIYGPCGTTYYENPIRLSEKNTLLMLKGEKHFEGYPKYSREINDAPNPLKRLDLRLKKKIVPYKYKKAFKGVLLGGCLDCLLTLCGTKYDNVKKFNEEHQEVVWFLEACDLSPLAIRRGLFQLKEAGWFSSASGFIIGRPLCQNASIMGVDKFSAVTGVLGDLNKPILMDCDLGHIMPVLPMKCGAQVKVSYKNNNLIMDYEE